MLGSMNVFFFLQGTNGRESTATTHWTYVSVLFCEHLVALISGRLRYSGGELQSSGLGRHSLSLTLSIALALSLSLWLLLSFC